LRAVAWRTRRPLDASSADPLRVPAPADVTCRARVRPPLHSPTPPCSKRARQAGFRRVLSISRPACGRAQDRWPGDAGFRVHAMIVASLGDASVEGAARVATAPDRRERDVARQARAGAPARCAPRGRSRREAPVFGYWRRLTAGARRQRRRRSAELALAATPAGGGRRNPARRAGRHDGPTDAAGAFADGGSVSGRVARMDAARSRTTTPTRSSRQRASSAPGPPAPT
jgi:hypothetical protein